MRPDAPGGGFPLMRGNPSYARYDVGAFTYGRPRVLTWRDDERLTIGKFCSIADGATFVLGGEHRADWVSTYPFATAFAEHAGWPGHPSGKGPITVGNDVWIAFDAVVLSGVTIGDGAIVGARSVVVRDVRPYAVVAGNPAKEIRRRFPDATVDRLLELKWWDWPTDEIRRHAGTLMGPDVAAAIALGAGRSSRPNVPSVAALRSDP